MPHTSIVSHLDVASDGLAAERTLQTAILLGRGERKEWALRVWLRLYGVAFPLLGAP